MIAASIVSRSVCAEFRSIGVRGVRTCQLNAHDDEDRHAEREGESQKKGEPVFVNKPDRTPS